MSTPLLIVIAGPTAVGKTDVACCLARNLAGEIVSCDAMQVYREISILNAKPDRAILDDIPHHCIDTLSVTDSLDVARYSQLATAAVDDIVRRGRQPLIVGGSGMYLRVLLDGIFEETRTSPETRKRLEREAEHAGVDALFMRLQQADPAVAARIHPHDVRRIIRALEVFEETGIPMSELQTRRQGLSRHFAVRLFVLDRPRAELYERINQRVEVMLAAGAAEEVAKLPMDQLSPTVRAMIGLEALEDLRQQKCSPEEAMTRMQQQTRRFAKRQLTWFRQEKRAEWIPVSSGDSPQDVAQILKEKLT